MKKYLLATMIVMLAAPLVYFHIPQMEALSNSAPFTPKEVKVLVISPASLYLKGGHYLISDLAGYGFNITQHTSDNSTAVDYRSDPLTSDLSQYDVVILHGSYTGYPPVTATIEEVNHFTNYNGTLIVVGNALFWNETKTQIFWDTFFGSSHRQKLEQRVGVDFVAWLKEIGATDKHNNGSFTLTDDSISGLSSNLTYITHDPNWINYQVVVTPKDATRKIYDFTTENGVTTSGVTYYENATGAVGIYIQGSYIYSPPEDSGSYQIRYFGLTDISKRSSLLASLIAYALGVDINTIIRPQPLATVILDRLGGRGWGETYLNTSLFNFDSLVNEHNIVPTIAFTDFLYESYWQKTVPNILSQLRGEYRDSEYASSLRNEDLSSMTQSETELLIQKVKANYTALKMDQFSTVTTFARYWNQTILYAMNSENLTLLDMYVHTPEYDNLQEYFLDWWNLRVLSNTIVHSGAQMGWWGEAESFADINPNPTVAKNILHYEYFRNRDKWALAVLNGFPSFVYSIWHFAQNEVGTYGLKTVYSNLTSEISEIQFVPLIEAGLYFGNKWVSIHNPQKVGSTIEFDIDSSAIPIVANIGKGMLWLRIDANETIRDVSIDGEPWFYFDDHTIRLPAESAHVKIDIGDRVNPTVVRTVHKVTETIWNGERLVVSVSATPGMNVSIYISIPFWNAFSNETQWDYKFDWPTQVLKFWAISDGSITLEVGADVTPPIIGKVDRSPSWYNASVTISLETSDLETGIRTAVLSYSTDSDWLHVTMVRDDSSYVGRIPAFPYGTSVAYKVNACDNAGNWRASQIFDYNVTDETPPEVGVPEWTPSSPPAGQPVHVQVSVVEPENASGLDLVEVVFFFERDYSTEESVEMEYDEGLWSAEIPGQSGGKLVSFFVRAKDKAGNFMKSDDYSYRAGGVGLPGYTVIFGLASIAIGIGVGLYFVKFRRRGKKRNS